MQKMVIDHCYWGNFINGDLDAKRSHWNKLEDSGFVDAADFIFWAGHGSHDYDGPLRFMTFFVELFNGNPKAVDFLRWDHIQWGDIDLEWAAINTCRFLMADDVTLKQMCKGVHLILGYETDMTVCANAGLIFADRLDDMTIKEAWHEQCRETQRPANENISRVFGAVQCMEDRIGIEYPVSRDPTVNSTYTHSDYRNF